MVGTPEKEVAYTAVVMSFMSCVVGHIASSSKAQRILRWLAKLVLRADGEMSLMLPGPANSESVSYASQRWLSQVEPLKATVARMRDLLLYLIVFKNSGVKAASVLGANLLETLEDL